MNPCDLSATEARALIGAKRLSARELVASCVERIEAVDHAVNAVVAHDFERATEAAAAADERTARGEALPPLHGLPVGIKDLEETAGLRTTWGSVLFRDHVPTHDLGAVARIRAAGGIVLGKTNVPEFGLGANTRNAVYGATGNPFDPARSAAGSSGGSAVALATNMVPLASGSDTGGSLRNPAAFCGIVGFRPTPGLVPNESRGQGWSPLPVLGPMARTVPDLCLLLAAMQSDDGRDPLATTIHGRAIRAAGDVLPAPRVDLAALRVAASPDLGFAPVERIVRDTFAARVDALTPLFGDVAHTAPDCAGADEAFEVLRAVGVLGAHAARVAAHPDQCGPNMHENVAEGLRYRASDVARALGLQTALYQRWQGFFARHDVLITPGITITPRPWRELAPREIEGVATRTYFHWLALAYAVTLVGHPALCLPLGRDAAGMPFGLQIVGPRGGDALVLGVAAAIEAAVAGDAVLARPVPGIAALRDAPPIAGMPGFMGFG